MKILQFRNTAYNLNLIQRFAFVDGEIRGYAINSSESLFEFRLSIMFYDTEHNRGIRRRFESFDDFLETIKLSNHTILYYSE